MYNEIMKSELLERDGAILEMLVREYIRTAEPVSSEKIANRMKSALSPATVRHIFADLTDAGFIAQPHTSGGRVPRERGYRFFVDKILEKDAVNSRLPKAFAEIIRHFDENTNLFRDIQERLARHLHVVSRFGSRMPLGFDEMFSEPEFALEPTLTREIGRFLDEFEDYHDAYNETIAPDSFSVMIGEENDIQPMHSMSVVVGKSHDDDLFFIAGPMRMPYEHIISMMNIWKKKPTTKK